MPFQINGSRPRKKDEMGNRRGPEASVFSTGAREGSQPKKEEKGRKCDFCEGQHDLNS